MTPDEFTRRLGIYMGLTRDLPGHVLRKKGTDLRIKLMREFKKQRWRRGKGDGPWIEARKRKRQGKGTKVRPNVAAKAKIGNFRLGKLTSMGAAGTVPLTKAGKPMNRRQAAVWLELKTRQRGIGLLGASLLEQRYQSGKLVANIVGGKWRDGTAQTQTIVGASRNLGMMHKTTIRPNLYLIEDFVGGTDVVDRRYGLVNKALGAVSADMDKYFQRKLTEAQRYAFKL